jgi:hypothetical protein
MRKSTRRKRSARHGTQVAAVRARSIKCLEAEFVARMVVIAHGAFPILAACEE